MRRRQGIVVAAGNPKRIVKIADLAPPGIRLVNRQRGSGTRLLFDALLEREGIDCRQLAGFDSAEQTHSAVAAAVASGIGDAGLAIETAAHLYGLAFVPLVEERYFLAYRANALGSTAVASVVDALRSRELHARLSLLPGLTAQSCGEIVPMVNAYPQLGDGASKDSAIANASGGRRRGGQRARAGTGVRA